MGPPPGWMSLGVSGALVLVTELEARHQAAGSVGARIAQRSSGIPLHRKHASGLLHADADPWPCHPHGRWPGIPGPLPTLPGIRVVAYGQHRYQFAQRSRCGNRRLLKLIGTSHSMPNTQADARTPINAPVRAVLPPITLPAIVILPRRRR